MGNKFTTSVNIIRDSERDLNYIPTPNGVKIINQICNDFKTGIRSFNIIGSYGTGKSAFLWAFQQSVTGRKKYFGINLLSNPTIEFINIIGEFKSIKEAFADIFDISNNRNLSENIFSEIFNKYHELGEKNPLLFIVIDEFGKFLEYAVQNEPEKELYFIQQLAEFANNPLYNIILFTTVHQNFDAYSVYLNHTQKQEWTKIKGRFKEITFNEPVEQLLYLAAEHLYQKASAKVAENEIKKALELFIKSKAFDNNADYVSEIAEKLFPMDLFTANILTLSLQKYGQNERSLFSFLESNDHTGINHPEWKQHNNPFYNISCVYDYIVFNYYSFINSRNNPHFIQWAGIRSAIEQVERLFNKDAANYLKIIKTIGLLGITAANGATLDLAFLSAYTKLCLGIKNAEELIKELERRKIIRYRSYNKCFILFEGTDLDIEEALLDAGNKVSEINDVPTLLQKYYQLPPIIAKQETYYSGLPRLFDYRISAFPIDEIPVGEIDGFINLVFNERLTIDDILSVSSNVEEAILYGYFVNTKSIKNLLFDIEKTIKVLEENEEDKVAVRELKNILFHQKNWLTNKILNIFYTQTHEVIWIYKGEIETLKNKKEFNQLLTKICQAAYPKTPIFINELVNKHRISSSIHVAKKNYFKALVSNWDKPDLGFEPQKFPPEKTIYLSLLKQNGIHLYTDDVSYSLSANKKNQFHHLWKCSNDFLESAKTSKRNLSEFIDLLGKRPYKLKQGMIDFWVPTFLFIRRNDFALFGENGYIPFFNDEILELLGKYPEKYEVKTFNIEGVKLDIFNSYRVILNQQQNNQITNNSFVETIKPFLSFYRNLPDYSKNTKRLSKEALAIREAIANSKDPEQTFFEDFPNALGFNLQRLQKSHNDLQKYTIKLQDAIKELRTCFDELVNRIELFIQTDLIGEEISFKAYKLQMQERFKKLRRHLLLPVQKTFVQRLDSQIDDKKTWLNSLVQAIIGDTLEKIKDEDEIFIYDKFKSIILELDSLTNISTADFKEDKEDIISFEITSFVDGMSKKLVRLPKNKKAAVKKIEDALRPAITNDKTLNIAALMNLLKEQLQK